MKYNDQENSHALAVLLDNASSRMMENNLAYYAYSRLFDSSEDAVKALLRDGLICLSDVRGAITEYTVVALKGFLKANKQPVSGNKAVLVNRVISMENRTAVDTFAHPKKRMLLSQRGHEFIAEQQQLRETAVERVFDALVEGNIAKAAAIWSEYRIIYDATGGLSPTYTQKIFNMLSLIMNANYDDLQNSNGFKRMLAATIAIDETLSPFDRFWWRKFLQSHTNEEIRCHELAVTARECNNGEEVGDDELDDDENIIDGYFVDVLEVYHYTMVRLFMNINDIERAKNEGAKKVLHVNCGKIGCNCSYRGKMLGMPIKDAPFIPAKYGCSGMYSFGW